MTMLHYLTSFYGKSPTFDRFMVVLSDNNFIKLGVFLAIFCFFWFKQGEKHEVRVRREKIIATLLGATIAVVLVKAISMLTPMQLRPIVDKSLSLPSSPYLEINDFAKWSSFPSDHAAFFFALTTGIFALSWRAGVVTLFYTILFIAFPRVYLQLHYLSDIVVGGIIGIVSVLFVMKYKKVRAPFTSIVLKLHDRYPASFYAFFILAATL